MMPEELLSAAPMMKGHPKKVKSVSIRKLDDGTFVMLVHRDDDMMKEYSYSDISKLLPDIKMVFGKPENEEKDNLS